MKKLYIIVAVLQATSPSLTIRVEENGKDLPTNYNFDDLSRRRRPSSGAASSGCNFNGIKREKYKTDGSGRTFFDLQLINVGYHDNYNINCGGGGTGYPAGGGINKPILGNHKPIHKPDHKPILGGHQQQGTQGDGGHHGGEFLANRPLLSMLLANRPLQGLFSQSQSQSDSQTAGVFSEAVSGIVSLLPGPQDIGQGLGEGISSFFQTLPQIGQSFQSLLPSIDNLQFPTFPSLTQGSQSVSSNVPTAPVTQPPYPGMVTPVGPDPVTEPADPDDIIYNDNIKPVHEDHDPVTDLYSTNKLPPGANLNRLYEQNRYQASKKYLTQKINTDINSNKYHYQRNRDMYRQTGPEFRQSEHPYQQYEGRSRHLNEERRGGRGFRFPS